MFPDSTEREFPETLDSPPSVSRFIDNSAGTVGSPPPVEILFTLEITSFLMLNKSPFIKDIFCLRAFISISKFDVSPPSFTTTSLSLITSSLITSVCFIISFTGCILVMVSTCSRMICKIFGGPLGPKAIKSSYGE